MIIEISVAVIAVAFVALVIYLIIMIKALHTTLGQLNQTLVEARKQLDEVGGQAQKVMENTNQISFDLKQKIVAFNPIFNAIANAGEILEHKSSILKRDFFASLHEENSLSNPDPDEKKKNMVIVAAIFELAGISLRLWQKLKKRR